MKKKKFSISDDLSQSERSSSSSRDGRERRKDSKPQILARSLRLTEKHYVLSLKYRRKIGMITKDYEPMRDPNVLSEPDWLYLLN